MISKYYIKGAPLYRVVGIKPKAKIFKLPFADMTGAVRELKEVKLNKSHQRKSGWGWSIAFEDGVRRFITLNKINGYLVPDEMEIKDKEKGMPF
mgnify:CR=1 FL=1